MCPKWRSKTLSCFRVSNFVEALFFQFHSPPYPWILSQDTLCFLLFSIFSYLLEHDYYRIIFRGNAEIELKFLKGIVKTLILTACYVTTPCPTVSSLPPRAHLDLIRPTDVNNTGRIYDNQRDQQSARLTISLFNIYFFAKLWQLMKGKAML